MKEAFCGLLFSFVRIGKGSVYGNNYSQSCFGEFPFFCILRLAITFCFLMFSHLLYGTITFERKYGGTGAEWGNQIVQTQDGDFIIVGFTTSFPGGNFFWNQDAYILKVGSLGDTLWSLRYGGAANGNDMANAIVRIDSNFVIVGYQQQSYTMGRDLWVAKLTPGGDTLWTRTYGGNKADAGERIATTSDNGFVIVGETQKYGAGDYDVWILRLNASGDTLWTRIIDNGTHKNDLGAGVVSLPDGKFLVAANMDVVAPPPPFPTASDAWFILLDSLGNIIDTNKYDYSSHLSILSMSLISDGAVIATGQTDINDVNPSENLWILKLNPSGDTVWTKIYGTFGHYDGGRSILQTTDGGFIVAGYTQSFGPDYDNVWLLRLNQNGDTLWTRVFGHEENDGGLSVLQTMDGGFIVSGYIDAISWPLDSIPGDAGVYLIKTDSLGQVYGIEEQNYQLLNRNIQLNVYPPYPTAQMVIIEIWFDTEDKLVKDFPFSLTIYDVKGSVIKNFNCPQLTMRVPQKIIWDQKNNNGQLVSAGIYFVKLKVGEFLQTKKLLLLSR
ncbi:MAG: T9SS type A sorting domain-containing protein [Candidatus Stahlbacteria bacterium]|nr:T9SS type A sorting domain-containing protein [Candidatus Stahlbacteria bacterium]